MELIEKLLSKLNVKSMKMEGITLIALIITVIIMLILAGVSISALTGAEGLFAKTASSADKYKQAANKENADIQYLLNEMDAILNEQNNDEPEEEDGEPLKVTLNASVTPSNGRGTYILDENITYEISIKNCEKTEMKNISITGENIADMTEKTSSSGTELSGNNATIKSLAAGETKTFTASHTVTAEDVEATSITSKITVSYTNKKGERISISKENTVNTERQYTLTIRYWYDRVDGTTAADTVTKKYYYNDNYRINSPRLTAYTPDKNYVAGTITSDTVIDVIYTMKEYTLTIQYCYLDGTTAAPTHTQKLYYEAEYSVTSPTINGYKPNREICEGKMPDRDIILTVMYLPESSGGPLT